MGWSELARQMRERQEKIQQLSVEDRATLKAAHEKASEDPAVRAAMANRDRAIEELQATRRMAMLKADPGVAPILKKTMAGERSRPNRGR
jgi:transposase